MKIKNNIVLFLSFILFSSTLFFTNNCGGSGVLIKSLPENDRTFLYEVGLIITKQEKKRFLTLTTQKDRDIFKKEFWDKRDPTPRTDDNEFKAEYYDRMFYADKYFSQGKKRGFKTDRGRIYMLLGPPSTQRFYPGRITSYVGKKSLDSYPHIIWLYGDFPVIFIDYNQANTFTLSPISSRHIGMLNVIGIQLKPKIQKEKIPLDFDIKLDRKPEGKLTLLINIAFSTISFTPEENSSNHSTTIEVTLKILNRDTKKEDIKKKEYKIKLTEENLNDLTKHYTMKFPFVLKKGNYFMEIILKNYTDKKETRKKIKFAINK